MRFKDIKVGDQVIVKPPGSSSQRFQRLEEVTRVTATQFVAGGYRFTKYGCQVGGDGWWHARADLATPSAIAAVKAEIRYETAKDRLRQQLQSIDTLWREIDRNHDRIKWACTLETASATLSQAVERLKLRQTEVGE